MSGLVCVILTYNEELHIERAIKSVRDISEKIVVVDSYSTDKTCEIAESFGVHVFKNPFINQAKQFQWAMENCSIESEWVLRLDADETIDAQLKSNIMDFIKTNTVYNGAVFKRKHIFLGKWVRFGGRYPLYMLRLFRKGTAHVEQRWMDEHIVLNCGKSKILEGSFEDNNLNSISWFIDKHNKYATREVIDIFLNRLFPAKTSHISKETGFAIRLKRCLKERVYMKLPYFIRPTMYFGYRYFFQLGFLDGSKGFAYHFLQAFWYRSLVDLKCIEVEMKLESAKSLTEKLRVLEDVTGYDLSEFKK